VSLVAFFVGVYGLMGLVWGPRLLVASFFPFFLFAFCLPLGGTIGEKITLPLRLVATKITAVLSDWVFGIAVHQVGTQISDPLGSYQYEVAAACSGIRSLTATLALALIYGFMIFRRHWKRLALVLSAFPLAIAANVFRLTMIIIAAEAFGQKAGNYVHESWWMSLLPYVPAIAGVVLLGRWLREDKSPTEPPAPTTPIIAAEQKA
jgi:exosortase